MPHRISTKVALVALAALAWLTPEALADKKLVQPPKEWTGSVADETLLKDAPECLTGPKGLDKLWKGWKIADPVPEVDFAKQIVVVAVTRGSRLKLAPTLDENGDLQVIGLATRDFRPGFRYVIATVPRLGIKMVNGQPLPMD